MGESRLQMLLRDRAPRATQLVTLSEMAARPTSVRELNGRLNDVAEQARLGSCCATTSRTSLREGDGMTLRYFHATLRPARPRPGRRRRNVSWGLVSLAVAPRIARLDPFSDLGTDASPQPVRMISTPLHPQSDSGSW